MALYIAHLADHEYRPATVSTAMSALSFVHKLRGLPDPTNTFLIHKMLKGFQKLSPNPICRLPITLGILKQLLLALPSVLNSRYAVTMYKAMFLLAFHACLRVGEITAKPGQDHNLHVGDVNFCTYPKPQRTSLFITFRSYKHSKQNQISTLEVVDHVETSPVSTLHHYLQMRGPHQGPLFSWQDRMPVSYTQFRDTLKAALSFAGFSTSQYKSHSFRIGRATLALEQGMSELQVMKLGRWSSTAHLRYLAPPSLSS